MSDRDHGADASKPVLEQIAALIAGLRYGTIEIVVHDGRVVQIQRKEKFRFADDARSTGRESRGGDD
ncbi:MAG TPA: YezD family protein [Pseudomonadales bacterium]|nr:YezD family protein [Pseudomonadales bacterium]